MSKLYKVTAVIAVCFLVASCSVKLPFMDRDKEKKVKVETVERIPTYCYVREGEDPCEVCENVVCQGGKEDAN